MYSKRALFFDPTELYCMLCLLRYDVLSDALYKMYVEKEVIMITRQWRLSLLGGCVLLLAFKIPYLFPEWDVYATQLLRTHLLFIDALLLILLYLLLWTYPQQQVAAVRDRKDRIDLESKSRQTLNHSTQDSYTQCHGNTDTARLRVLPVCQCCVA